MSTDQIMWDSRSGAMKPLAGLVALWSMALAGCQRDRFGCDSLIENARWSEALTACTDAFDDSGEPRWGKQAAFAAFQLTEDETVHGWVDRLAGTPFESKALGYRAYRSFVTGDLEQAELDYLQALDLDQAAEHTIGIASSSFYLYYLAWNSSRYREAYEHAARGHEAAIQAEDPHWTRLNAEALTTVFLTVGDLPRAREALAAAQKSLDREAPESAYLQSYEGLVHVGGERPALAVRSWRSALAAAEGSTDTRLLRSLHLNIVELELDAGNVAEARRHLDSAWTYVEEGTDRTGLLFYRAAVLRAEGHLDEALADLDSAASTSNTDWSWQIELARGEIFEDLEQPAKAEEAYRQSANHVESLRRDLELNALKSSLLDRRRRPFERLFALAALAGRHEDALNAYERIKARSFLDALVQSGRKSATSGATGVNDVASTGLQPSEPSAARTGDRVEAISELVAVVDSLGSSPSFSPRPIDAILPGLAGREIAGFLVTADRVWLVRLGEEVPDGSRFFLLAVEPRELDRAIESFVSNPEDVDEAARLGAWLFPDGALPAGGGTLYVATDRRLGDLPLAALRVDGKYLVEHVALAQIPSLTALTALTASPQGRMSTSTPALVFGDPTADLPEAAMEAREVATLLATEPTLGSSATRAALADRARPALLHFAAHSGIDAGGPWLGMADGRLSAADILNGSLGAPVVVLASCSSGARVGSGLWGSLGATFLAAGSRSVVASLWSLDDRIARELIVDFYRRGGADDPVEALAELQRASIVAGRPAGHWAPLTVLGISPGVTGEDGALTIFQEEEKK